MAAPDKSLLDSISDILREPSGADVGNQVAKESQNVRRQLQERGLTEETKNLKYSIKDANQLKTSSKVANRVAVKTGGASGSFEQPQIQPVEKDKTWLEHFFSAVSTPGNLTRQVLMKQKPSLSKAYGDSNVPEFVKKTGLDVDIPGVPNAVRDVGIDIATDPLSAVGWGTKEGADIVVKGLRKLAPHAAPEALNLAAKSVINSTNHAETAKNLARTLGVAEEAIAPVVKQAGKTGLNIAGIPVTSGNTLRELKDSALRATLGKRNPMYQLATGERAALSREVNVARIASENKVLQKAGQLTLKEAERLPEKELAPRLAPISQEWVATRFKGMPPDEQAEIAKKFSELSHSLIHGKGAGGFFGKITKPVIDVMRKTLMFANPVYHINNVAGDSILMAAGGFKDPRKVTEALSLLKNGEKAAVTLTDNLGKKWNSQEILREAGRLGIVRPGINNPAKGLADLDVIPSKKQLIKKLKGGPELTDALTLGTHRVGEAFAEKWGKTSRLAMFMDALKKSGSVELARDITNRALYDYSDPGNFPKFLEATRNVAPFGGWAYRSATEVPAAALKRPLLAALPSKVASAFTEPGADEPSHFVREKNFNFPAPRGLEDKVRKLAEATGFEVRPGVNMNVQLKEPFSDVATTSNPKEMAGMALGFANPLVGLGFRQTTGQQLGRPPDEHALPTSLGAVLNSGSTGGMLPALEAKPGQAAWGSESARLFVSPVISGLINEYQARHGRTAAIGVAYPEGKDSDFRRLAGWIKMVTGVGISPTTPLNRIQNLLDRSSVKETMNERKQNVRELKKNRSQK